MTYCQRIFSRGKDVPTLAELRESFEENEIEAEMTRDDGPVDATAKDWTGVDLTYQTDRKPVRIERVFVKENVEREARSFLDLFGAFPDSPEKKDVINQLEASEQVYVFTVPTEDIIEAGWRIMSTAQQFFVEATDGILQVDGEGFFYLDEDTFDVLLDMGEE
ncbi:MAG: hypothetical protein ACYS8W_17775 [Planctomycetota bacterium]|jgi:hypothetical protein